jgi:hypothetical protein
MVEFKPIEAKEFPIYSYESVEDLYALIGDLTLSFPFDKSGRPNFFFYYLLEDE